MRRLHPLTLALLAASGLPVTTRKPEETEQHPPEVPPLGKTLAASQQRIYQKGRQMGLRNLVGGPVRMHRPDAPNKPQAPSNPKAEERRRRRLRDTIMKHARWMPIDGLKYLAGHLCARSTGGAWVMNDDSVVRLAKAGIVPDVAQAILDEEPPPGEPIKPELAEELVREVTMELINNGMVIVDDAGPVPESAWIKPLLDLENRASYEANKHLWDGVTEQRKGENHGNADSVDGDGVPDLGRG